MKRQTDIWNCFERSLTHDYVRVEADHLGSSSFITDATGYATEHLQYLPYGELFVDQTPPHNDFETRYKFSGKELDPETNYSYFGARYYDSDLSVWLSVDPLSDKYPNLSSYAYCANNPVMLVDPNGDTISVSNDLLNNKDAYEGYQRFLSTRAGKKFVKQYGEGGKNYDISVVVGIDENQDCPGNTSLTIVNNGVSRDAKLGEKLTEGEFFRFEINVMNLASGADTYNTYRFKGSDGSGNAANSKTGMKKNLDRVAALFRYAEAFVHEVQHLRIMTRDLRIYGSWQTHPYWQHDEMMNTKGEYYQERVDFFNEYKSKYPYLFRSGDYNPNAFEKQ